MQNILIIRSVSYQQLDTNLLHILAAFPPGSRIHLLTHEHGAAQARAMSGIDDVHVYPHRAGFHWHLRVPQLGVNRYDAVVIPVTNLTGSGFNNVMLYSLTLNTLKRVMCNVRGELSERTSLSILGKTLQYRIYAALAACGAVLAGIVAIPVLLLWILRQARHPRPVQK